MAAVTFPRSPAPPLRVAAGQPSPPQAFEAPPGILVMIGCVHLGPGCTSPSGSATPTVSLVTDGTTTPVTSVNDVDPTPVAGGAAFATVLPGTGGVFRVQIDKPADLVVTWAIVFGNEAGTADADLTWVVGASLPETQVPWIRAVATASPVLPGGAAPGDEVRFPVRVDNRGPGDLVVGDAPGPLTGTPWSLRLPAPLRIRPNRCADLDFAFTVPSTSGPVALTYPVASNDPGPTVGPEHNASVALSASFFVPPALLDAPFSPPLGAPGTRLTITGRDFDAGDLAVTLGTVPATPTGPPTATSVTVTVPDGLEPGEVEVSLRTRGGPAPASAARFVALGGRPTLSTVPPTGVRGSPITLLGGNFDAAGGETLVAFDDELATITSIGASRIEATVPSAVAPGQRKVTVATRWGFVEHPAPITLT